MAWSPQRSKDTYAPIRSVAYARTHGGFEPPPDPAGSVMYLVCNRRRQIWRLKPNIGQTGGAAFQVEAQRGPLWPDTGSLRSTMGAIDGDLSGAWYIEYPASPSHQGPPQSVTVQTSGELNGPIQVPIRLHRLDADLNLVASYGFQFRSRQIINLTNSQNWPIGETGIGGSGDTFTLGLPRLFIHGLQDGGGLIDVPGGIVAYSIQSILAKCQWVGASGTSIAGVGLSGSWSGGQPSQLNIVINPSSKANEVIPLPNYSVMLNDGAGGPITTQVGGGGSTIYSCKLGGPDYIAKWENGNLAAYKTPANATPQDQFRAQCIGGSSGVCYTTENNNEIVLRDGGLNLTARFRRADIEQFLGATNPANGISNFTFTGIGGR